MGRSVNFGYSPCPNDTFAFYALVHGLVDSSGHEIQPYLADVEELNRKALRAELEMTKLSFHALGHVLDNYALLRAGSALGRACGPLVVARRSSPTPDLAKVAVAVPGRLTTAHLLLSLFLNKAPQVIPMEFNLVMEAVASGRVDAGLVIHEGRFTYDRLGLVALADLGEWWEKKTGLPIPLGCIAVRRDLEPETALALEKALAASVRHARRNPAASQSYVLEHAQEMETQVVSQHINLYVNEFTEDLGDDGLEAVRVVLERARRSGLIPSWRGKLTLS